jgi:hypothetical protein
MLNHTVNIQQISNRLGRKSVNSNHWKNTEVTFKLCMLLSFCKKKTKNRKQQKTPANLEDLLRSQDLILGPRIVVVNLRSLIFKNL